MAKLLLRRFAVINEVFKVSAVKHYWTVMTVMMKFVQDPSQNPMVKWLQEKAPVDLGCFDSLLTNWDRM